MADNYTAVERYISLWNETNDKARDEGITELFTADATYVDPMADVSGHAGIGAMIAGVQGQFSGYTFKLLDKTDSHHHTARFGWEMLPPGGGESVLEGTDVAVFADDGKIRSIYGFLDKVPSA